MKRNLLFAAALMAGVAVSAQEVGEMDFSVIASETATAVPAGTTVALSDNFKVVTAFDDSFKQLGTATDEFEQMIFDGNALEVVTGVTGNSNPTNAAGSPSNTYLAPTAGCAYKFIAPGDINSGKLYGYFYAIGKLSSNKQYWVSEEGVVVGHDIDVVLEGTAYHFSLPGDPENLNALSDDFVKAAYPDLTSIISSETGLPDYSTGTPSLDQMCGFPRGNWNGASGSKNGLGYIKFAVYEGCEYMFGASGSKMSLAGFYFDPEGDAVVTLHDNDGAVTDLQLSVGGGGDNAISSVESAAEVVAEEYYTVSGVRVAEMVPGLNLVKQTLSDGSVKTVKVIK